MSLVTRRFFFTIFLASGNVVGSLTPKHITTNFWVYDEERTYAAAKAYCKNEVGTRLAEIGDATLQTQLWNNLGKDVWQGLKMGSSGRFEWSDSHHYDFDSDIAYENWDSGNGQPNTCVVMLSNINATSGGQWYTVPCQNSYQFGCIRSKFDKLYIICKRHSL